MAEPNWTNRTMWTGDNLDIMRGMNSGTVDLIYLDPPFNSNRIDLSPLAANLVRQRIQAEGPLLYDLTHRTDIPRRTDQGKVPPYRTQKHTLFGQQEGHCNGCRIAFPFRNFTVDHVIPRSRGGTDHTDNLQLLCGACNSQKGDRTQAELVATLRRNGILADDRHGTR